MMAKRWSSSHRIYPREVEDKRQQGLPTDVDEVYCVCTDWLCFLGCFPDHT